MESEKKKWPGRMASIKSNSLPKVACTKRIVQNSRNVHLSICFSSSSSLVSSSRFHHQWGSFSCIGSQGWNGRVDWGLHSRRPENEMRFFGSRFLAIATILSPSTYNAVRLISLPSESFAWSFIRICIRHEMSQMSIIFYLTCLCPLLMCRSFSIGAKERQLP